MAPGDAPRDPRDVLADRIEQWASNGDWKVYDYVDRLLADLDAAGFEIFGKGTVGDEDTAEDFHDEVVERCVSGALAQFREYDGTYGPDWDQRLYHPASVVNALGPRLELLGRADELGFASATVHPAAPVFAWVSPDPGEPLATRVAPTVEPGAPGGRSRGPR